MSISTASTARAQAELQYAVAARLLRLTAGSAQPAAVTAIQQAAGEALDAFSEAVMNLASGVDVYA
jgi:hypothetical protein